MRSLIFFTLIFMFCGIGVLSVLPHEEHSLLYKESEAPWKAQIQDFQKLIKTDADAARSELQNVAKKLFGEHILTQEWIPLYFRISKDGTTYSSDLKRVSELEIRMLKSTDPEKYAKQIQHHREAVEHYAALVSDLKRVSELEIRMLKSTDPEKYAKQIQHHREAVKHYTTLAETFDDRLTQLEEKTADVPDNRRTIEEQGYETLEITDQEVVEKVSRYLANFAQLLPKDPKASRAPLDKYAKLLYENHPLTEEWKNLFFRLCRDKEGTIPELIRLKKLEKQMLTDIDAEKHAAAIKSLEHGIKLDKLQQKSYERQGKPNTKESFKFSINVDPEVFKEQKQRRK